MLGSIGAVLALGAVLAFVAAGLAAWLPWEASAADRFASVLCGIGECVIEPAARDG